MRVYHDGLVFESLARYRRVAVTGPQRSGTTIAAKMIAVDTGFRFFDEQSFGTFDTVRWRLLLREERVVVQCPHMLRDLVDEPPADTFVVLMRRPLEEIHTSDARVGWSRLFNGNDLELRKFGLSAGDSAAVKYEYWDQHEKRLAYLEVTYESLAGHPLFVTGELRKTFHAKQTSL
jgi:hypothetical protein